MMARLIPRALTAGVLAATLGLAASATPARAATTNAWRLSFVVRTPGAMTGVAATGPANAWAVGYLQSGPQLQVVNKLYVVHWNGKTWRPVIVPGGVGFVANSVEASSASNVWIFAENDFSPFNQAVFRYDGTRWHEMSVPDGVAASLPGNQGNPVPLVLSAADVWTVNDESTCTTAASSPPKCVTDVWHWNGRSWKSYALSGNLHGVAGVSAGDVLAVGLGGQKVRGGPGTVVAYRWNGTRWATLTGLPQTRIFQYASVAMDSPSDIWIGAGTNENIDGIAMRWNGHRWTTTPSYFLASTPVVPDGHGGVWLSEFAHWTGRSWVSPGVDSPLIGMSAGAMTKVPGTSGSFWGASSVEVAASQRAAYPGITVYGPLP